jgi:ATP phosphoribosyltransferase
VVEVLDLGFGKCALQVQIPQKGDLGKPEDLIGKNVVTSFTNLAEQYFRRLEAQESSDATNGDGNGKAPLKTKIKYVGGSVEAACALGVADGIVDLVESGETMRAAGLKAISTVVDSSAFLIKSKHPSDPKLVDLITARIKGVISKLLLIRQCSHYPLSISGPGTSKSLTQFCHSTAAQKFVLCTYNIERTKLHTATQITPGKRAPTINSLEEEGWVAVNVMVERKNIALTMDELTAIGAEDIIVTQLENYREGSLEK